MAEEMAMVDVYSRGRLECGFVRGVPYEISAGNHRPTRMQERFWEAHDLIVKAWTSHDGPFNWEGKYFHHRQVNIWPQALPAAASADLDHRAQPGQRARGRRAGLRRRLLPHRLRGHEDRVRLYREPPRRAQATDRGARSLRLRGARLRGRDRRGGLRRRAQAHVVPRVEQGAAAVHQPAGLPPDRPRP